MYRGWHITNHRNGRHGRPYASPDNVLLSVCFKDGYRLSSAALLSTARDADHAQDSVRLESQ